MPWMLGISNQKMLPQPSVESTPTLPL
jgi:hypothetical protein